MEKNQVGWKSVKHFVDDASSIAVEVSVLPLPRPRWSFNLGCFKTDKEGANRFVRFLAPELKVENAVATVLCRGMIVARLLDEASLFVQEQVQQREDEFILRKQMKERAQIERQSGAQDTPKTGKTVREVDKRARHEHNAAARRAADQELRQKMRGK